MFARTSNVIVFFEFKKIKRDKYTCSYVRKCENCKKNIRKKFCQYVCELCHCQCNSCCRNLNSGQCKG